MKCNICHLNCIKAGRQSNGKQKYFCKSCQKYFQKAYRYRAYEIRDRKKFFITLHNEGNGIRGMSRILNISCTTVMKWKLIYSKDLIPPKSESDNHTYQIDEMYTFVKSKDKPVWVMYSFDATTNKVVNFKLGSRSKENLAPLVDEILTKNPERIGTDGLLSYRTLIPPNLHKVGLRYTRHIERNNLNMRMHIKYLGRKTICYSKSIKMLESSLKLYFWG